MLLAGVAVLLVAIGVSAVFVRRWQKTRALDRLRADAIARYVEGEHAEALPMLAQYERNRPGDAEILLALARVRREVEMGDQSHYAKAARLYQSYRAVVPEDTEAAIELLELYALLGQHPEAITLSQRILSDESVTGAERARVLLTSAQAHRVGNPDSQTAMALVNEAVEHDPSSFEAHLELTRQIYREDPLLACEHAAALTQRSDDARFRALEIVTCDQRSATGGREALETLEALFALATEAPGDAFADEAFVDMLLFYANKYDRDDVTIAILRRAAETGNKDWATRYIRRLYQLDLFQDVVEEAPRIAALTADASEDLHAYALIARFETGDAVPADLISEAEQLEAESGRGRFREKAWASAFRGLYAMESGDARGADTFLAQAIEDYPAEPLLHAIHGQILADLQRFEPARERWQDAQDLAGAEWRSLEHRAVQSLISEGRYRAAFDRSMIAVDAGGAGWRKYYPWFESFVELLIRGRASAGERAYVANTLRALDAALDKDESPDDQPDDQHVDIERRFLPARVALASAQGEPIEPIFERPVSLSALEDEVVLLRVLGVIDRLGLEFPAVLNDQIEQRNIVNPQLSLALAERAHRAGDTSAAASLSTPDGGDDIAWSIARARFADRTAETPDEKRTAAATWRALFEAHPENLDVLAAIFEAETTPLDAELIDSAAANRARITGSQGESVAASVVLSRAMAVRRGEPTPDEHAASVAALQQVVTRAPTSLRARIYLAELYLMDRPELGISPDRARAAGEILAASELIGGAGADGLRSQGAGILHSISDYEASRDALFRIVDAERNPSPELLYRAGQILLAQGDPDSALGFLTRAEPLAEPENRAAVLVQIGRAREARAQDAQATRAFTSALEAGLNDPDDVLAAATHFARVGDEPRRAQAMSALDALDLEPGQADLIRARHALNHGETDEAFTLYESVVAQQPGWSIIWAELGRARLETGDLEGAADVVSRGLDHSPDSGDLRLLNDQIRHARSNVGGETDFAALAEIYDQQEGGARVAEAARALDRAAREGRLDTRQGLLTLASEYEDVQHLQRVVGTYLIERINAFDDAGDLLMRGADRFPADPEFPRLATIAYENAGDWESMQNAAQLWRRRDPMSASSSDLAIAESAARLGQAARADTLVAEYLDEALAEPGDASSLRVLWLWARLRINAGDTATVEDRLAGLIADSPDLRRSVWLRAVAELVPDWETARRWLALAEPHESDEFGAAFMLDTCRRRADQGLPDRGAAVAIAESLAPSLSGTENPAILEALADLARVRAELAAADGRQSDAEAGYQDSIDRLLAAAEMQPTGSEAWVYFRKRAAAIADGTGRLDAAIDLYRSTLADASGSPALAAEMRNDLAYALSRRAGPGDLENAANQIALALEKLQHPALHHTRGKVLEAQGQTKDAAGSYRAALALDPGHPASLASLALLLARGDTLDRAEARQYIERSDELDLSDVDEGVRSEFATAASLLDDG